jgi:hypothetical protein
VDCEWRVEWKLWDDVEVMIGGLRLGLLHEWKRLQDFREHITQSFSVVPTGSKGASPLHVVSQVLVCPDPCYGPWKEF